MPSLVWSSARSSLLEQIHPRRSARAAPPANFAPHADGSAGSRTRAEIPQAVARAQECPTVLGSTPVQLGCCRAPAPDAPTTRPDVGHVTLAPLSLPASQRTSHGAATVFQP